MTDVLVMPIAHTCPIIHSSAIYYIKTSHHNDTVPVLVIMPSPQGWGHFGIARSVRLSVCPVAQLPRL